MPTHAPTNQIRAEFDAIARLMPQHGPLGPYESWLLDRLPARRDAALEIGCGVGNLTRLLARTFAQTVAIDLAPGMIEEARRRTSAAERVDYVCADMFEWLADKDTAYDCIVSVGTLHHVDLPSALSAMRRALRPGGRLLIVDLCSRTGWRRLLDPIAWVAGGLRNVSRGAFSWRLRTAYRRHGANETYLTRSEVATIARAQLPGAEVRERLLWRYTLVWER